jgi:hypothetical protein
LGQAVDDAIRRRLTGWDEIAAVRARHARRGRNGTGKYHLNEQAFEADPVRQNRVEIEGWTVLRYTWKAYSRRPQVICAEVAAALRRTVQAGS